MEILSEQRPVSSNATPLQNILPERVIPIIQTQKASNKRVSILSKRQTPLQSAAKNNKSRESLTPRESIFKSVDHKEQVRKSLDH